jgi:hypothetical protein
MILKLQKAEMNKRILYLCFLFFIVLMRNGTSFAASKYDDITISIESAPSGESYFGYAEYKIQAINQSTDTTHKVTVSIPSTNYGSSGDVIKRISRTFVVSPLSTASASIFQPPMAVWGQDMTVIIDGKKQEEQINVGRMAHCQSTYYPSRYYRGSINYPNCILLSRSINSDDFQNGIDNAYSIGSSARTGGKTTYCNFVKSDTSVQDWSTNWLSYSRYEGVVVSASDMEMMPVSIRDALLEHVNCGGTLLILGKWQQPSDWQQGSTSTSGVFVLSYLGFGVIIQSDTTDVTSWSKETWKKLRSDIWIPTSAQLQGKTGIFNANQEFPVVKNLTMPVRGLFLLVLLFAVVIGPANLIFLSYKKKKIWMLWTVPAISIVGSLAIFFYSFFAEGWRGYERIQAITILNEKNHSSATIATNAFYCPMTPRQGLHFSYETEVTPLSVEEAGSGRERTVDWSSDQHLDTGWVAARVPAHFMLRKSQVRRERLKINITDSKAINVVNGLGCDISKLYYADNNGRIYFAENIKAGEQKELIDNKKTCSSNAAQDTWRNSYANKWYRLFEQLAFTPANYLKPNSYLAFVEDCPFIEKTLESVKDRRCESVIFGFF